jgi:LysM repeat protein
VCTSLCKNAVASAVLMVAAPVWAGDIVHTVKSGETLESIAKQYYGDSWKAVYLGAKNDLEGAPKSGARLTIPASWIYKVKRGDSAASIAKRYLGDADRYVALMSQNGVKDPLELQPGVELLMPFHLGYAVQKGDNWNAIARRFYRSSKNADLVKTYNASSGEPAPGTRVTVPIFDRASAGGGPSVKPSAAPTTPSTAVALATPKVDAPPTPAAPKAPEDPKTSSKVRSRLKNGINGYHEGNFDEACPSLEELLGEIEIAQPDRATLIRYLGFCSVAFGDTEAARDYFKKWIEIEPGASLDPVTTSPKILSVWKAVAAQGGDGD